MELESQKMSAYAGAAQRLYAKGEQVRMVLIDPGVVAGSDSKRRIVLNRYD